MKQLEKYQQIERSIITKYRKTIWKKFTSAISEFDMIKENDKIAVCISGGKDSMLMAKCMQEIKKHGHTDFELEFIVMNPGYNEKNRIKIEENAKLLNIPIKMFETQIFDIVHTVTESPCYLCARMRRGNLYSFAKSLGCNKIALGHHFDDVCETVLMSMFYGCEFKTMMPKLHSTNFEGMELIRPLYFVSEEDIVSWSNYNGLEFIRCACRFTENLKNEENEGLSKRLEMKNLISEMKKVNKNVCYNIYKSTCGVNLKTIIGYKKDGELHSFLDEY